MSYSRRTFLGGAAAAAGLPLASAACAQTGSAFTPEAFGARGDGVTNDTEAFGNLAAAVNRAGGGIVRLRRATYIVGSQAGGAYYPPRPLLDFRRCSKPLVIEGNGAVLRCAEGLRYGTFNRVTGAVTRHQMPYYETDELATPYRQMILAEDCTGPIQISNLELDGNLKRLRIGGPYGDTGWQVPCVGILLKDNRGDEIIRDVYSHHHGQDGMMIDGIDDAALAQRVTRLVENFRAEYNGRQGCSIVGGRGYHFVASKFAHTGKAGLSSAPGAGVDIEAEGGKKNRDFAFIDCEFSNNAGVGLLADTGDSDGASFSRCTFIGTTAWSAWPFKPHFRFNDCKFVGALVRLYGDDDPSRATQFHDCTFRDDPKLSPTGEVYIPNKPYGMIVDGDSGRNALFSRCTFILTHNGLLPYSWHAIYSNCRMEQRADGVAYPKGKYLGHNTIRGRVDLYGTQVIGTLVVNGDTLRGVKLGG